MIPCNVFEAEATILAAEMLRCLYVGPLDPSLLIDDL
jgi:hypothetical protein